MHNCRRVATTPDDDPAVDGSGPPQSDYLKPVLDQLTRSYPDNRMINIVCHGHSVPAGYFETPDVRTLDSYPHLLHVALKKRFPYAIINVIVTAVGGEDSECGAARFDRDVLQLRPNVLTIDYALNDRKIGLQRAETAWRKMIESAMSSGVRVILLTPSADLEANPDDPTDSLRLHALQVRELARHYRIGLADSDAAFRAYRENGGRLDELMAQARHPNRAGHQLIANRLASVFVAVPDLGDSRDRTEMFKTQPDVTEF